MSHALTVRTGFVREHSLVLALSAIAHFGLLVLLSLNLELWPAQPLQPVRLAIQATVVDSRALQPPVNVREQEDHRVAEEQRRAEEDRRKAEAEKERIDEERSREAQVKAEQQKKQERLEAARRIDTEKVRQAKLEQDHRLSEERQRAAEEMQRKADADRRKSQVRADLARQMAEEERLTAAQESGQLQQYAEVIRQKVERNWIKPGSARAGLHCVVNVKQIPGGEVVDVRVGECNGDAAVVRSIEAAVLRSSPLPAPPDASLFDRSLRFDFNPQE